MILYNTILWGYVSVQHANNDFCVRQGTRVVWLVLAAMSLYIINYKSSELQIGPRIEIQNTSSLIPQNKHVREETLTTGLGMAAKCKTSQNSPVFLK